MAPKPLPTDHESPLEKNVILSPYDKTTLSKLSGPELIVLLPLIKTLAIKQLQLIVYPIATEAIGGRVTIIKEEDPLATIDLPLSAAVNTIFVIIISTLLKDPVS